MSIEIVNIPVETLKDILKPVVKDAVEQAISEATADNVNAFQKWPDVMTTKQASAYMVSKGHKEFEDGKKIYNLKRTKKTGIGVRTVQIGGNIGFPKAELDRWLQGIPKE